MQAKIYFQQEKQFQTRKKGNGFREKKMKRFERRKQMKWFERRRKGRKSWFFAKR